MQKFSEPEKMEKHLVDTCEIMPHICLTCGGVTNRSSSGHLCETLLFERMMQQKALTRDQTRTIMNSVKRRDETVNKLERLLKQQASDFAKQLS